MSNAAKLLDKMRRNPRDWRIEDLRVVAARHGLTVTQGKGSHVNLGHPLVKRILTIPANRQISPYYIKLFVELIDEATEAS